MRKHKISIQKKWQMSKGVIFFLNREQCVPYWFFYQTDILSLIKWHKYHSVLFIFCLKSWTGWAHCSSYEVVIATTWRKKIKIKIVQSLWKDFKWYSLSLKPSCYKFYLIINCRSRNELQFDILCILWFNPKQKLWSLKV